MFHSFLCFVLLNVCFSFVSCSWFPPKPQGITTLRSRLQPGVTLSYKQTCICETTPGVKSYGGYIHLPASALQDVQGSENYNLSVLFWFFEARNDPLNAPFAVYLGGGPGETSLYGATYEGGPCYITPDSNGTILNPWSMNNRVNMLYIDQPNMVGFSYSSLMNATVDMLSGEIKRADFSQGVPFQPNDTLRVGTLPVQDPSTSANNTMNGARVLWHFVQNWFDQFPLYRPKNDKLSLWANSYGGYYAPAYFSYFLDQNKRIVDGDLDGYTKSNVLNLDTVGILNGCLDFAIQGPFYPQMAYNNTYGLKAYNETIRDYALHNFNKRGGCSDLIAECRRLGSIGDPQRFGSNQTVNTACVKATQFCLFNVLGAYNAFSGRSNFDIAHLLPEPYPPLSPVGFLNKQWVQRELGVPVNFTLNSNVVQASFFGSTGDPGRQGIEELNKVLQNGVKVAMVYGDRDYQCNWLSAEAISLSASYPSENRFRRAGYAPITTNSTYHGGVVRQYGNFSFSRVFEAGHSPAYQPETVYRIFNRAMFDKDVATGLKSITSGYSTQGPSSSFGIKNKLPSSPPVLCNVWSISTTCTEEQISALTKGTAVVRDFVVVKPKGVRR